MRASNRRFCSLSLTSSQNLTSWMPPSTMYFSIIGTDFEESIALLLGAEAHHRLDARARLYQLRSKMTTSPAAGKCCM